MVDYPAASVFSAAVLRSGAGAGRFTALPPACATRIVCAIPASFIARFSIAGGMHPAILPALPAAGADAAPEITLPLHLARVETPQTPAPDPEHNKVQQRCDYGNAHRKIAEYHIVHEKRGVDDAEPLHPDRDDEHQQHLHVRKRHRIRQEDRHVHIIGAEIPAVIGKIRACPIRRNGPRIHEVGDAHHDERAEDCEQQTAEDIDIIPPGSPGPLERRPDAVVKQQHNQKEEQIVRGRRHDHPGDQPPYLPVHDRIRIQREIIQKIRIDEVHQITEEIADDERKRKIADRISPQLSLHLPVKFIK